MAEFDELQAQVQRFGLTLHKSPQADGTVNYGIIGGPNYLSLEELQVYIEEKFPEFLSDKEMDTYEGSQKIENNQRELRVRDYIYRIGGEEAYPSNTQIQKVLSDFNEATKGKTREEQQNLFDGTFPATGVMPTGPALDWLRTDRGANVLTTVNTVRSESVESVDPKATFNSWLSETAGQNEMSEAARMRLNARREDTFDSWEKTTRSPGMEALTYREFLDSQLTDGNLDFKTGEFVALYGSNEEIGELRDIALSMLHEEGKIARYSGASVFGELDNQLEQVLTVFQSDLMRARSRGEKRPDIMDYLPGMVQNFPSEMEINRRKLDYQTRFELATGRQLPKGQMTWTPDDIIHKMALDQVMRQAESMALSGQDFNFETMAQERYDTIRNSYRAGPMPTPPKMLNEQETQELTDMGIDPAAITGTGIGGFAGALLYKTFVQDPIDEVSRQTSELIKTMGLGEDDFTPEQISKMEATVRANIEKGKVPPADFGTSRLQQFRDEEQRVREQGRQEEIDEYIRINTPDRGVTEEEALRPFQRWDEEEESYVPTERPEGESDASWNRRRDEALETVTQPDPSQVAPTEAEARTALSGMNIFKEDYTMPGFEDEDAEPDIVPTAPPPPGLSGRQRRTRRQIS